MNVALLITWLRIVLTPFVFVFVILENYILAVVFFIIAALTDMVDGYFARRLKQETKLGKILDPVADKVLIAFTVVALTVKFRELLPLTILIVGKEIVMLLCMVFSKWNVKFKFPTILSKVNTVVQIIFIVSVILGYYNTIFLWIVFCLTLITAIDYLIKLMRNK